MAAIKEESEDDLESLSESEFYSVVSGSDTSIDFALPPIGNKQSKNHHNEKESDDCSTVTSQSIGRFPRGRRASCPAIMGWDKDHLKYLVAGSNTLPEPVVSRAYQSLLSHTEPILKQNKPKEKRVLSYYDYVPSRKVYNEQDQFVRDQDRHMLKWELMVEERRRHQEAIAMEKELLGDDYNDPEDGEKEEEELEDIMLKRRLRRLHVTDSAYQGFFPQMDLYDFGQREKERQKQAQANSVQGKGRVQRRGSESHLKRRDSKPGQNGQHGQNGPRTERQLIRRESFSNELNQTKKLERTNTQTKINVLTPSQPSLQHRFISTAQPQTAQTKSGTQEMQFNVLSAMRSRFPEVRRTTSGMTNAPMAPGNLRQEPLTAPASTKFKRKRTMSLGNTSVLMPLRLAESLQQAQEQK